MKRELKDILPISRASWFSLIARLIPMKRELKAVFHVRTNLHESIARLIPMKRELKARWYRSGWLSINVIARLIPMKRELKVMQKHLAERPYDPESQGSSR